MSKHLAQRLVILRRLSLASQAFPEFRFDHAERGFDVRPLVIVSKEFISVEVVEVKQTGPR
jgi:hypothetical protein